MVIAFFMDLFLGTVWIPPEQVLGALFSPEGIRESWQVIIMDFRLPKALTAVLVGAGLSLSGLLMQTLFRNPLAGPFVLGISSGASLGVAVLILAGFLLPGVITTGGAWGTILAAISGAAAVLLLVLLVSIRIADSVSLLIIGLMLGSATGALVSILQYFSAPEQIQAYLIWTFGSLAGVDWPRMQIFLPLILLATLAVQLLQKPLNAFLLGETYARTMGIDIGRLRIIIVIMTSLIAGGITAFCGPIAFIGIAVPHLARSLLNTADHRLLIPASVLIGALLMLVCDILAQLPGNQTTLPINAITALLGAPVVIWVILKNRNLKASF